jgi:hypothetical protein
MSRDISGADLVAYMGRHLVALTCRYELLNEDGTVRDRGVAVYSGFVLDLEGMIFWVTAGHCLKDDLDANISSGKIRITGGSFMDGFGYQATHFQPIPYRYEIGNGWYVESAEHGFDFAIILLDDLIVKAFAANKVIAISRENWVHQPRLNFDFYRILGIPKDQVFVDTKANGNVTMNARPVMIAINKISIDEVGEPPANSGAPPSADWFIGRIDPECGISDIAGMSGGPIFGFRKVENELPTYHVVALQSRWWDKSRTIFGCSLPLFAEEVHRQVRTLLNEPNGANDASI